MLVQEILARGVPPIAAAPRPPAAEPIPHKLTVEQFAWCIERSAYFVNERSRIDKAFRKFVEGTCPKKIHPCALQLFGVDPALGAARLALFEQRSAA